MPKLTKRFIDKLDPPSKNPGKDLVYGMTILRASASA